MSSQGRVDVHVDPAGLGRVHSELRKLLIEVEQFDDLCAITADGAAMGSGVAATAIAHFGAHWRSARTDVAVNVRECVTFIEMALHGYEGIERMIERAASVGNERGES